LALPHRDKLILRTVASDVTRGAAGKPIEADRVAWSFQEGGGSTRDHHA
jgi:hypothetical protein